MPFNMSAKEERFIIDLLLEWGRNNRRGFPWRETHSPYRILISEVLLQQTLATKVANVYEEFFSAYPTPAALANADVEDVVEIIRPCGLQNRKAPALITIGQRIRNEGVPDTYNELVELPFVNEYAANAMLSFAFDEPRPIVDVNVIRVFNRYFGTDFEDAQDPAAWEFAERLLPEDRHQEFNFALLDFGATICTDENPHCNECPLNLYCKYYDSE